MPILYLTEQGSYLRRDGGRLRVEKDRIKLLDMPLEQVEGLCIFGNIQISTQIISELFDRNISAAFFNVGGKLRGQLTPVLSRNSLLRVRQFEIARTPDDSLMISCLFVKTKIQNSITLLKRYHRSHAEVSFASEIEDMERALKVSDLADSLNSLLGYEGTAARTYWSCYGRMLRNGMVFPGRVYRPCTDPVNALLSFGYSLMGSEIRSQLEGIGLDPYIGFYHTVEYGRASLAQDLLEEFRAACVDRFTLYLLNNRMLNENDFERHPEGVRMTQPAMKLYFKEYERFINRASKQKAYHGEQSFRSIVRLQAQKIAKWISSGEQYSPYLFED